MVHPVPPHKSRNNVAWILGGVVILLMVVLLIVIGVAIGKSGNDTVTVPAASSGTTSTAARGGPTTTGSNAGLVVDNRKHLNRARYIGEGATKTMARLTLTAAYDLSPTFAVLSTPELMDSSSLNSTGSEVRLYQSRDRSIGVLLNTRAAYGLMGKPFDHVWAYDRFAADGKRVEARDGDPDKAGVPELSSFDQALQPGEVGYFNIVAGGGQQVPDNAKGIGNDQVSVLAIQGDAFDKETVWAVLRGTPKLYKLKLAFT